MRNDGEQNACRVQKDIRVYEFPPKTEVDTLWETDDFAELSTLRIFAQAVCGILHTP